jgi:hypothetical protein
VKTPTFPARMDLKGKLETTDEVKRALTMWNLSLAGKNVVVMIEEEAQTRSAQANRYYWGVVLRTMEQSNIGYTDEEFHELMLAKFATKKHYEIVNQQTGEVVEEYDITERSSAMKGKNFYKFVEQVRQFLAEFYGVVTEDPDPEYWLKPARKAA